MLTWHLGQNNWKSSFQLIVAVMKIGLMICLANYPVFASEKKQIKNSEQMLEKWRPWFEVGGYVGNQRTRGEGVFWGPLVQDQNTILFTDIRGKLFEADVREGNFAVGLRQMLSAGWNAGGWLGYDVRTSERGHTFQQLGTGFEMLSPNWDVRVNGYAPFKDEKVISSSTGGSVSTVDFNPGAGTIELVTTASSSSVTKELVLWGLDAEIGYRVPLELFDQSFSGAEMRFYAGGFYFDNQDLDDPLLGPRFRLDLRFEDALEDLPGSRLTLEAEWQRDNLRGEAYEVGARLRIPLFSDDEEKAHSYTRLTLQERRMNESLERDTDIVAQTKTVASSITTGSTTRENVEDALTGTDLTQVVEVNAGGSLTTSSTSAGDNSLIVLQGDITGSQTLQGNQTLIGAGGTLQVRGLTTGNVVTFTAPGTKPNIDQDTGVVLTLSGDNAHVTGVDITGGGNTFLSGNDGISASSKDNIAITNSSFSEIREDAIQLPGGNDDVIISNVEISNSVAGLWLGSSNQRVTVTDMTVSNISVYGGIWLDNNNQQIVFSNTQISDVGRDAIYFSGGNQVEVNNSLISGTISDDVIDSNGSSNTLSGSGNRFTGTTGSNFCELHGSESGSIAFDEVSTLGGGPGSCP